MKRIVNDNIKPIITFLIKNTYHCNFIGDAYVKAKNDVSY